LLVEPGAKLARELMARNQADRAWVLRGQVTIGEEGLEAAECPWPQVGRVDLNGDDLSERLNPASPCWFAAEASADLRLVGTQAGAGT
jgi:hypothetical protein